jgi:hypothetical protein
MSRGDQDPAGRMTRHAPEFGIAQGNGGALKIVGPVL